MPLLLADVSLSAPLLLAAEHPYITTFLAILGATNVLRIVLGTLSVLGQTFLWPGTSLKKFGAKKGAWALVTGASDGIGAEFAVQLAKAGFNIILAARNPTKLDSVKERLSKYGVDAVAITVDFSNAKSVGWEQVEKVVQEKAVSVLVNNVGISHAMPTYFAETPAAEIDNIVAVNIAATLRVTQLALPGMVQRKRGLILNVGSFAGAVPSPMLATYSGSKAFLATWSTALAEEVRSSKIVVEHLNTFFVVSNMSKIRRSSPLVPTPAAYVRSALSKVGLPCGAAHSGRPGTSTPYWSHAIADWVLTLVAWPSLYIGYTHGLHKSIRKRALKKLERESKAQ
ncbi:hypothetical protein PLICRDRAFT_638941 [Plicaturopsis crispa FD-325 SS-3]|nr:hypothetical protein PLICRDRAFT_638941 [Plicaturopsis crispa FD-325 SS-3]